MAVLRRKAFQICAKMDKDVTSNSHSFSNEANEKQEPVQGSQATVP